MSAAQYVATRFSTLKPPMHHAPNPFRLLSMMNGKQWLNFLVGFSAWVCYTSLPFRNLTPNKATKTNYTRHGTPLISSPSA